MINVTRTTLSNALGRWQRGIARACQWRRDGAVIPGKKRGLSPVILLAGALAGMTVGGYAQAQISFRAASSASQAVPSFRAANSAGQSTASAPAFQAAGSAASGSGSVTPAWPAHAIDDIALLFVESAGGEAATLSTPAGFAAVANSPQATGSLTAGTQITVFWARATSTSMASPTVADPGDHVYARILTYRGVDSTGNPWDVTGGGVKASASATVTVTGVTTTVATTLIVQAVARDNDSSSSAFSAQSNGNLTGIAERSDEGTSSNNGGGIGIWDGVKATAGATGSTTATVTSSINAFLTVALRPATSKITITKPAGTATDDVLVASIGFRLNSPGVDSRDIGVTAPAGWTLVRRLDNQNSTSSGLAVYRLTAGGSEPANYTWTFSCRNISGSDTCVSLGFSGAAGGIAGFSGANTTTPIDVENGQSTTFGTSTPATPSVTTTVADTMLVTSHAIANANTWQAPPTSGMTQAFQVMSGTEMVQVSYARQTAAGATGTKTATDLGPDAVDFGNAHILVLQPRNPGTTPGFTIPKPAGTVSGDFMVAAIGVQDDAVTITPPTGWTLLRRTDQASGTDNSLAIYTKAAGGSEPASYTWGISGATWSHAVGGIQSFLGVDTANGPVNVENGQTTASSTSHTTPDVTPTVANVMLVTAHTFASSRTWTAPAGMTEAYDIASLPTSNSEGQSIIGSYAPHVFLATGVKTATASGNSDTGNAHILALRPLPATGVAGGFNAYDTGTAAGATSGYVKTKIAGSTVSVAIVSLNLPRTAIETSFTGTVRVEVLNASDNSGALDANGCRSTWTVLQTLTDPVFVAGDLGRKTVTFTQANSYQDLRLKISFPTTSPTRIGCSNDNFAMRPDLFTFTVTDTDWQTAGTGRTLNNVAVPGGITHKAGRPFTVQATALNAAGTPVATTNYVDTPIVIPSVCTGSACTASFGTFALGASFVAGLLASNVATYSEVGSIRARIRDSTFSNVDASDGSSGSERDISSSNINIGRFVPDNFTVALNTPSFGTACGAFTYVGQNFNYATAPVITVTARNFAGGTTTLYAGALWQITSASLTGKSYTSATGTLDTSGITGTDPVIADVGSGVGTLTFGSGTGLFFTRTTPVAPFDADISLAINLNNDADGVTIYASNPARFGQATAGNGIAFSSGKPMRFGRLVIRNANGSQLLPLPVQVEAQYWSGAPTNAFITNTLDNCTTVASANETMDPYTGNLSGSPTCETAISGGGALNMGRRTLLLAAPGSGNTGSVNLKVNLGAASGNTCTTQGGAPGSATTANSAYLQGNWTGSNYDQNPTARATFGVSRGAEEVIFVRENF